MPSASARSMICSSVRRSVFPCIVNAIRIAVTKMPMPSPAYNIVTSFLHLLKQVNDQLYFADTEPKLFGDRHVLFLFMKREYAFVLIAAICDRLQESAISPLSGVFASVFASVFAFAFAAVFRFAFCRFYRLFFFTGSATGFAAVFPLSLLPALQAFHPFLLPVPAFSPLGSQGSARSLS